MSKKSQGTGTGTETVKAVKTAKATKTKATKTKVQKTPITKVTQVTKAKVTKATVTQGMTHNKKLENLSNEQLIKIINEILDWELPTMDTKLCTMIDKEYADSLNDECDKIMENIENIAKRMRNDYEDFADSYERYDQEDADMDDLNEYDETLLEGLKGLKKPGITHHKSILSKLKKLSKIVNQDDVHFEDAIEYLENYLNDAKTTKHKDDKI